MVEMSSIFLFGFPITIALSYAIYFIFAGWMFSISEKRSKNSWYQLMKKSIFLVGLFCALVDTAMGTLPAFLLVFLAYLGFAIISSWGVLVQDGTKEKNR